MALTGKTEEMIEAGTNQIRKNSNFSFPTRSSVME